MQNNKCNYTEHYIIDNNISWCNNRIIYMTNREHQQYHNNINYLNSLTAATSITFLSFFTYILIKFISKTMLKYLSIIFLTTFFLFASFYFAFALEVNPNPTLNDNIIHVAIPEYEQKLYNQLTETYSETHSYTTTTYYGISPYSVPFKHTVQQFVYDINLKPTTVYFTGTLSFLVTTTVETNNITTTSIICVDNHFCKTPVSNITVITQTLNYTFALFPSNKIETISLVSYIDVEDTYMLNAITELTVVQNFTEYYLESNIDSAPTYINKVFLPFAKTK